MDTVRSQSTYSKHNRDQYSNSSLEKIREDVITQTKPLLDYVRKIMEDSAELAINKSKQSADTISFSQLLEELFKKIEGQLKNRCYFLMHTTLEYALTDNDIASQSTANNNEGNESDHIVGYLHAIKQHMQTKPGGDLERIGKRLFGGGYSEGSEEEGFFDEFSEFSCSTPIEQYCPPSQLGRSPDDRRPMRKREDPKKELSKNGKIEQLEKENDALQEQIEELKEKVKNREEIAQVLTTGYVKDMTHMKEMLFRQSKLENPEFYEVQYFDGVQVLSEKDRTILNEKLKSLKMQYERKTQELLRRLIAVHNETEKYKKLLNAATDAQADGLVEALKKVFQIEESPYKIWKAVQDLKGNAFIFTVFEKQRPEMGINYKEVNKMMMSKKAYESEYAEYKAEIDEQICSLIKKTAAQLEEMREELAQKDKQIDELCERPPLGVDDEEIKKILAANQKQVETKFTAQIDEMTTTIDREKLRSAILRWSCIGKMIKSTSGAQSQQIKIDTKKMLTLSEMNRSNAEVQLAAAKEEIQRLSSELQTTRSQQVSLECEKKNLLERGSTLREKTKQLCDYLRVVKKEKHECEMGKTVAETLLKQVFLKMGTKLSDEQFEDLDLEDDKKASSKVFQEKLKGLNKKQLRAIRESQIVQNKVDQAKETMYVGIEVEEKGVQTVVRGVTTEFRSFEEQTQVDKDIDQNYEDTENGQQQQQNQGQKQGELIDSEDQTDIDAISFQNKEEELKKLIADSKQLNTLISQAQLESLQAKEKLRLQIEESAKLQEKIDEMIQQIQDTKNAQKLETDKDAQLKLENQKLLEKIKQQQNSIEKSNEAIKQLQEQCKLNKVNQGIQKTKGTTGISGNGVMDQEIVQDDMKEEMDQLGDTHNEEFSGEGVGQQDAAADNEGGDKLTTLKSKSLRRENPKGISEKVKRKHITASINTNPRFRVFQRLFEDSKDKESRMEELTRQLKKLETLHWQEVLSILNLYNKDLEQSETSQVLFPHQESQVIPKSPENISGSQSARFTIPHNRNAEEIHSAFTINNNKFPSIPTPGNMSSRAEYYFKRNKEFNQNSLKNTAYASLVLPSDIDSILGEGEQEDQDKNKICLEQIFDSYRKQRIPLSHRQFSANNQIGTRRKSFIKEQDSYQPNNLYDQPYSARKILQHEYDVYRHKSLPATDNPNEGNSEALMKLEKQVKRMRDLGHLQDSKQSMNASQLQQPTSPQLLARLSSSFGSGQQSKIDANNYRGATTNPRSRHKISNNSSSTFEGTNVFLPDTISTLLLKGKPNMNQFSVNSSQITISHQPRQFDKRS